MYRIKLTAAAAGLAVMAGAAGVLADEHEAEYPPMQVVEGWTCSYLDGKGPADLDKANAAWNDWMDKTGQDHYTAAIITPYFYGERTFDLGWLGVAKDGTSFGKGTDLWVNEGGDVGALFMDVMKCNSHTAWVSMLVDTPDDEDDDTSDNNFVVSFSNCTMKDGYTFDDYMKAAQEWDAYSKEHGIKGVAWVWFPVAGEANNDYEFKVVAAEDDFVEMGANWQKYLDGHWQKSSELFDSIVDCDVSRTYNGTMIRRWKED